MLKRLVPSLFAVCVGGTAVAADGSALVHFQTVQDLIKSGLRLPAERAIADMSSAGYDQVWVKGIRYEYADYFRTEVDGELADKLEAEAKVLEKELTGLKGSLPPEIAGLLQGGGQKDLSRWANLILKDMNPDAPPPLVKFTPEEVRAMEGKVRRLIKAADASLDAAMASIQEYEAEVEKSWDLDMDNKADKAKYDQIIQTATLRRYEYCQSWYIAYEALREVVVRGEQFGLSAGFAKGEVEAWLHAELAEHAEKLSDWEWNYADYYPLLRHRLAVMTSEIVRLNQTRESLATIGSFSYDDVKNGFFAVTDLNLETFPPKFRDGLTGLKLKVWGDLLQWHLLLGSDRALTEGVALWEDFTSRSLPGLTDRDKGKQAAVGHVHLVMARLFNAKGESGKTNEILVNLSQSGNFFAVNGKKWLTFLASNPSGGGSGWAAVPVRQEATVALNLGNALRGQGKRTNDSSVRQKLFDDAATAYRNGLLGLPPARDPAFVQDGPRLYQAFAYHLYDTGRLYESVVVAKEGLERFKPLWERSKNQGGNPWKNREGALTSSGELVKRLSGDLLAYTQNLRRRDPGDGARDAFGEAIKMLKIFDEDRAGEDLAKIEIIILVQQEDFEEASRKLDEYAKSHPDQKLWALGTKARVRWGQFDKAVAAKADESRLEKLGEQLDAAVADLTAVVKPVIDDPEAKPAEGRAEYEKQWRFLLTIQISRLFKQEKYPEVLSLLGPDFWQQPPDDRELNRQLFNFLAAAAYKVSYGIARDSARSKDPGVFQETWPQYQHSADVYEQMINRYPELIERLTNNRKQLAAVFNIAQTQARWFSQNIHAKTKGFEDLDKAEFDGYERSAKGLFARLFPIEDDTKPKTVLAVALALWDLERTQEAMPLFERYKALLEADPALQAFRQEPTKLLEGLAKKLAARSSLRKFWERKGDDSIVDLLVDEKGFIEQEVLNPNKRVSEWSEEKRDFGLALGKVRAFDKELKQQRNLIPGFDAIYEEFTTFKNLVEGLAYSVSIDTKLVEAYRVGGRLKEAVELAGKLWAYDPLNPTFMALVVEGTIEAINAGDTVSDDQARKAQEIAARLRNLVVRMPGKRDIYWISSCQVLELSSYLKDSDLISKTLNRHVVDRNLPPLDLAEPGSEPLSSSDQASIDICARYLRLFDLPGVNIPVPYRIEERDGLTIFVLEEN